MPRRVSQKCLDWYPKIKWCLGIFETLLFLPLFGLSGGDVDLAVFYDLVAITLTMKIERLYACQIKIGYNLAT